MSIVSAVLQGILQGLTEFLPVSSSGHLSLFQYFTGINSESSVTFSVMLHLGTLLAVIIAFRGTVWQLLREFFLMFADLFRGRLFREKATPYRRMLYLLMLSCVPLLLVLPLQDVITSVSADNDILVEGICFLITSALLFLADRVPNGRRDAATMKGKHALAIGTAQLIATLPGISRSGSTISVGRLCGLERSYAVSYSFIPPYWLPASWTCMTQLRPASAWNGAPPSSAWRRRSSSGCWPSGWSIISSKAISSASLPFTRWCWAVSW